MSTAGRALKRPADFDSDDEQSEVVDLCSSSSGDEAAGGTGSAGADSDASYANVSEDSDSEADDASGTMTLWFGADLLYAYTQYILFLQKLLCHAHRCRPRLRGWSLSVWLWMVCACMPACIALIGARLFKTIDDISGLTRARSLSNVACAPMPQTMLAT